MKLLLLLVLYSVSILVANAQTDTIISNTGNVYTGKAYKLNSSMLLIKDNTGEAVINKWEVKYWSAAFKDGIHNSNNTDWEVVRSSNIYPRHHYMNGAGNCLIASSAMWLSAGVLAGIAGATNTPIFAYFSIGATVIGFGTLIGAGVKLKHASKAPDYRQIH